MRFLLFVHIMCLSLSATAETPDPVREALSRLVPTATDPMIRPSGVPGITEVSIGLEVFYITDDGRFVFGGPLIATADRSNLTETSVAAARLQEIKRHEGLRLYRYPADAPRQRIIVFTDIDCPHCRKLHADIPEFQRSGIDVSYVMLPRTGKGSPSYLKTVAAACADDPEKAITAAMSGASLPEADCEHPIDEHLALVRKMGVTSTPTILLQDGRMVVGRKTATELTRLTGDF